MGLVDKIFGNVDDYVTVGFVVFLIIAAMYFAGFDVSAALGNFKSISKYLIGFAAAAAGVYIIHHGMSTRSMSDDVLDMIVGIALIGLGGAVAFGGAITSYFSQAAETVKTIVPLAIGGAVALVGTKLTQSRDKMTEMLGIVMIVIGLSLLGFKLSGLIG